MTDTINGKTADEIKKGLECCRPQYDREHWITCYRGCSYSAKGIWCRNELHTDTIAYIQQLETRLAQAERDAKEMAGDLDCSACTWCEYFDSDYANEACKECRTYNEGFKLRGVCEGNTKEEFK